MTDSLLTKHVAIPLVTGLFLIVAACAAQNHDAARAKTCVNWWGRCQAAGTLLNHGRISEARLAFHSCATVDPEISKLGAAMCDLSSGQMSLRERIAQLEGLGAQPELQEYDPQVDVHIRFGDGWTRKRIIVLTELARTQLRAGDEPAALKAARGACSLSLSEFTAASDDDDGPCKLLEHLATGRNVDVITRDVLRAHRANRNVCK